MKFAIVSRHGYESKSANHRSLDHVVEFASWCIGAMPSQYLEIVVIEGLALFLVAFNNGPRHCLTDGTSPTAVRVLAG
jgi:hypothetical protein